MKRLERRLEESIIAWLRTNIAFDEYTIRERVSDDLLRADAPEGEVQLPVKPIIVVAAQDEGRHSITPIRSLRASIIIRANAKVDSGNTEAFDAICGELENMMGNTNLKSTLDSVPKGVRVMLATIDSQSLQTVGLLRIQTYNLRIKAVRTEQVV